MNIDALMAPKSVALIGASNKPGSLGYDMVMMIKRGSYEGNVYPLNPRYEEVCGIKCYPDLNSIGTSVDVVVMCVSAKRMIEQVDNAIASGAKALVIFANCVIEGDTFPTVEEQVIAKCKAAGIPLLGHNAMGFYNNDLGLRICGFEAPDEGSKGNIALISQSGSIFSTIGHNDPQLKFNIMVATGTGQVTSLCDYMLYALEQPTTKVLGVYMESVRKPETFMLALETAAKKKIPVVLMKVGKSQLGAQFAKSHTGGLAGDDDSIQAIFDHYGVIRANSLDEMANTLAIFSYFPETPKKGGLAAIADSGGERNLLADVAEMVNLDFAKLSDKTMNDLDAIQEFGQEAANPLDPWGTGIDFERIFGDSFSVMLEDDNVAVGLISQDLRDGYYLSNGCIDALEVGYKSSGKPVVFLTNYSGTRRSELTERISKIPAPTLVGTEPALKAIKNYIRFGNFKFEESKICRGKMSQNIIEKIKSVGVLKEAEAMAVLKELGFPIAESTLLYSEEDLKNNAEKFDYPVVLKTAVDGILHKADVGGVVLNIRSFEQLKQEYTVMSKRLGNACIVAPMVKFDTELIFGMKTDPTFGPLVIVGAGGIFTELLRDKIVLTPSASKEEIKAKLQTLKTYKLLTGFRGTTPINIDILVDTIKKFCEIAINLSEWINEIDINPVAVTGNNIVALDALMICN